MVSITLSVSDDLKQKMTLFPEINWSAVAREAINRRLLMLEKFKEFSKNSTLTEDDALEFGRDVGAKAIRRHRA